MADEELVISVAANDLRTKGFSILAECGNQMRAFRFLTSKGRRKAPDFVICQDMTLFVFEAKTDARALFLAGSDGLSDYQVISELVSNPAIQHAFLLEAERRLSASGRIGVRPQHVCAGLLAGTSIINACGNHPMNGLTLIKVDAPNRKWIVEAGNHHRSDELMF